MTHKFFFWSMLVILTGLVLTEHSSAQLPDSLSRSDYSGVMFIPSQWSKVSPNSTEAKIADTFNDRAHDISRLYVADWWWVEDIIDEEGFAIDQVIDPSLALTFGEICEVGDVFLFEVLNFRQTGSSEKADNAPSNILIRVVKGLFKALFEDKPEDKSEPNYNNIRTELVVRIRVIDVNSEEIRETFSMNSVFTGGVKEESLDHALEKLGNNMSGELRRRYTPNAVIKGFDHTKLLLNEGRDSGLIKGKTFEIFEPDYLDPENRENSIIYGKSAGYARITFADSNLSRAAILRQWLPVDTGYTLVEMNQTVHGTLLDASIPVAQNYMGLGLQINYQPTQQFDGGGGIRILTTEDNYNTSNWGVGFGFFGSWRLLNMPRFALKTRLDGDLNIFFRTDDADDLANLPLFSLSPGITAEFLLHQNADLVVHAGYRLWGKSSSWEKSGEGEDETIDAYWESKPPKVDLSGFFLKIGYRFHFKD